MITLLHGDDTTKSRNELQRLRGLAVGKELRELDGKTVTEDILLQSLSSSSLFGDDLVVIIENLFSSQAKKIKRVEALAKLIVSESQGVEIILWEEKEVGKTALTHLGPKITVRIFSLPVIIFQFLDSVRPRTVKTMLPLYRQVVEHEAPELVHALLLKRFRQILELKSGITPPGMQSWQISRLTNQAQSFTIDQSQEAYKKILQNDLQMKTGSGALSLQQNTELLLTQI